MEANGIFQGYRWWDLHGTAPLFPFGHGLSYTQFSYAHLTVSPVLGPTTVSFDVTNSGSVAGDEVPQIYVGSPASPPVPMAVKALGGFKRISLAPGQTRHVTIEIAPRAFSSGAPQITRGRRPGAIVRSPSAPRRATSG
jgi:beta-glucosidase